MMGTRAGRHPNAPVIKDPFAVIPVKPDNVDMKRDSQGMIHLRLRVEQEGLAKKIADWLGYDYTRKVELDEYGTEFFSHIDGETNLNTIIETMHEKFGKSRKEMEQSVVLFTKKLMVMHMIALVVPESAVEGN